MSYKNSIPNPLKWKCRERGCFNEIHRPKLEKFSDCFPGNKNFGDVDGMFERNKYFLFYDWKSGRFITRGQEIAFTNLTELSPRIIFLQICGDAETMEVRAIRVMRKGVWGGWEITNFDALHERITRWYNRVEQTRSSR